MTDATDCQLLNRFVRHRDEWAFTTLARRHAARVRGVCRRLLRNEHDAEEVAQATFVVLARKAGLLSWGKSVGPWLSAVARRLALNARARRYRKALPATVSHEESAAEPCVVGVDPADAVAGSELCGLVRDELARLPEKYRAPVVLCYLEGKTNEQAAQELGWPTGSMSRRLEKARQLLRQRLADRGLLLLSFLAVVLTFWLLAPMPPSVSPRSFRVAAAMNQFHAGDQELLQRVATGNASEIGVQPLSTLASEAPHVADHIEELGPRGRETEWKGYTQELRITARNLANALSLEDRHTTRAAAGRLHAVCLSCHAAFRH